jgi:quercetin dioxygenase-like cupin family protein
MPLLYPGDLIMKKTKGGFSLRVASVLSVALLSVGGLASSQSAFAAAGDKTTMQTLPPLDTTIAGERLEYLSTAQPEISTEILTIAPGTKTKWMTHPVPAYLYVLQGTLIVEFQDGKRQQFSAGQAFLQSRTQWHRGVNDTNEPVKFLAVFMGSKGVPVILHPPTAQ